MSAEPIAMRRPVEVPIHAEPRLTSYTARRGSYGRVARIAKFVLPLLALGLAGLIVAWSQINPIIPRIPLSEIEVASEEIETIAMENPRFAGVDAEGRSFNVTADRAIQSADDEQHIVLQQPKADFVLADGTKIAIRSDTGDLRRDTRILDLSGSVTLVQDGGYEFRTTKARIDLEERAATGDAIVEGHGPTGEIRADGFEITDRGERVVFRGRTRALFQPTADRDTP
jgi:lipopolysaccharide export system protein LptC